MIFVHVADASFMPGFHLTRGMQIHVYRIPYSLKISKLKIFADFTGQSKATKFFSREIFNSSLILGVAGSSTTKILSVKICV